MRRDGSESSGSGFLWRWRNRRLAADPTARRQPRLRTEPVIETADEATVPERAGDE